MTSVFVVLMVRQKLSQALEKWSMFCCIFPIELLLRAQLSAYRSSLSKAALTLVMALTLEASEDEDV